MSRQLDVDGAELEWFRSYLMLLSRLQLGPQSGVFACIDDGLVYIANGQNPDHGEGTDHLWRIDSMITNHHNG